MANCALQAACIDAMALSLLQTLSHDKHIAPSALLSSSIVLQSIACVLNVTDSSYTPCVQLQILFQSAPIQAQQLYVVSHVK